MTPRYKLKLFLVLLAFAIVVTFTIATIDYFRLKQQTISDNELHIEQVTETVKYALNTIDKAYYLLDEETAKRMEKFTGDLQKRYEKNPNFESWDFQSLSKEMGMDIYILDAGNEVVYSNNEKEVGLDFSVCCKTFNSILNERRTSGELYIDGIDVDQKSGEVKKFSYMATNDKKYIIELGYSLENEAIFQEFNFLNIADELVKDFTIIEGLNILNFGGLPFGTVKNRKSTPEQRKAFEQARETNKIVEINSEFNGEEAAYRYIPYQSVYDKGSTQTKVVELIYNKNDLDLLLHKNLKVYIVQLIVILIVTILVASFIANWFAKPVYLAFHDSLTNLKNRAAFDDSLQETLANRDESTGLLMMDLDNFKLVNDYFGHGAGDYVLKLIAQTINTAVGKDYEAFRLGGDEFAVILPGSTKYEAKKVAQRIINLLQETLKKEKDISTLSVSVSVGIALSKADDNQDSLFKKADIALYESKEKGKNQYQLYENGSEPHIPFVK